MKIATAWTPDLQPGAVIQTYDRLVAQLGAAPSLLIVHCPVADNVGDMLTALHTHAPQVALHGGTSCLGVMTQAGAHTQNGGGLALFGIVDPEGSYGVGAAVIGDTPGAAARQAINTALDRADRRGETPTIIWMTAAPGCEEELIAGIAAVVGDHVPIAGGSAADNTVRGEWKQFANGDIYDNAVVVTALFPSTEVMFSFHSGYEPTHIKGTVTKAMGRTLMEIDGRPAAAVYNEWLGGLISDALVDGGNILSTTSLHPLGRIAGSVGSASYYVLSHPNAVTADGALTLFTHVARGDELVLMSGTADSLIARASRVVSATFDMYSVSPADVAGALIVYCAGCMLTVKDRIDEVAESLRTVLPDTPILATFTFGEQGCFLGGENRHGNLMISVLLFRKR